MSAISACSVTAPTVAEPAPFKADDLYSWIIEKQASLPGQRQFQRYLLAYSGGVDSTALVLAMHQIQDRLSAPLLVVHVNHGLHSDADRWADRCKALCNQLKLPLQLVHAQLSDANRKGLEARAREARYAALSSISHPGDLLLTGQHADDQGETVLLHLMRGSGVEGLAAIHPLRPWNNGWLGRPLLNARRRQLEEYVAVTDHSWSEDPSNQDLSLRRNYLRHKVLPLLLDSWPQAVLSLNQSAAHCNDAMENLAELAAMDIGQLQANQHDRRLQRLALAGLTELPMRRQRLILRHWIRQQGWQTPGAAKLNSFLTQLSSAGHDARSELCWQNHCMASHSGYLYLNAGNPQAAAGITEDWSPSASWYGHLQLTKPTEINFKDYKIHNRRGGESIKLFGRQGTHTLKKLFQEAGIPPWLRSSIPLLYSGDRLLAVGDLWLDEDFCLQLKQAENILSWKPSNLHWAVFRNAILKIPGQTQEQ